MTQESDSEPPASSGAGNTAPSAMDDDTDTDDNDAYGNPLKRAPQEALRHNTLMCFLPRPKSDDNVEAFRRYAGCVGTAQKAHIRDKMAHGKLKSK